MTSAAPRTAFVTGAASQGIGRSISIRLAQDGFSVALNDIPSQEEKLSELGKEIESIYGANSSQRCVVTLGDVSSEGDVKRMFDEVVNQLGGLDVMVANAGIYIAMKPILETSLDAFDRVMSVNVRGMFLCYQYAASQMIKQGRGGRIIGASSLVGKQGSPSATAYSTSKFAIRGLTQSVAQDLGKFGITVNAYAPGAISSDMLRNMANDTDDPPALIKSQAEVAAVKRVGEPEDVAGLVSFLASDSSSFMTGQTLTIDGGRYFD